jgi:hypothetical protein
MKNSEIFEAAHALLLDPKHWTQMLVARDNKGTEVNALNPDAVCWCLAGALIRVAGGEVAAEPALTSVRCRLSTTIGFFNDHSTHQEVLDFLALLTIKAKETEQQS